MLARQAQEDSEIVAILWHQGESDSHSDLYLDYKGKLLNILQTLRSDLNISDVPIIIGGLPDGLGKSGFGLSCSQFETINEEILKTIDEMEDTYFVTADNLTLNPDGIHIDAPSIRRFGVRYYESFKHRTDITKPIKEDTSLNGIYQRALSINEKLHQLNGRFALGRISFDNYMNHYQEIIGATK